MSVTAEDKTAENATRSKDGFVAVSLTFFRLNKPLRIPFLILLFMLILVACALLTYLCWYLWLPMLWAWGFSLLGWQALLALLGTIYLVIGPFVPLMLFQYFGQVVNLYLLEQEEEKLKVLKRIDADQSEIEKQLEDKDESGLVPLIHYSRLQLEAYYRIGLDQTQRSFKYSIISMWLGFSVIMIGISTFFLPVSLRQYFEGADVKSIPIIGGVVIEIISALFLWIYRSSIIQLTYFYNRQLDNHNVLICSRLASSMKNSDRARTIIITKFMEYGQKIGIS